MQQLAIQCSLDHLQESLTRISEDVSGIIKTMSAVICYYQSETEEKQEDESEMSRPQIQVLNRQLKRNGGLSCTRKWRFTLYEKMAIVHKVRRFSWFPEEL